MPETYVLYHAPCHDGFGAAWAVWNALGDAATYLPVSYGQPMPDIPDGAHVAIVDFSYPRAELEALAVRAGSLIVLDHHATAQEDLVDLPFAIFDLDKSGARLAWEHWHPHEPLPELLAYVEDRDLWRFSLPNSRAVAAAMRMHPFTFQEWDRLNAEGMHRLVVAGDAILDFIETQVTMICRQVRLRDLGGHTVPVVNATAFWSEIGEHLLSNYPYAPFAASYYDRADGQRQWSLRSRPGFDVSAVARQFGGGGHRQAAGFVTPAPCGEEAGDA